MTREQIKDKIRNLECGIKEAERDLFMAECMGCENMERVCKTVIDNAKSEIKDLERQL